MLEGLVIEKIRRKSSTQKKSGSSNENIESPSMKARANSTIQDSSQADLSSDK